MTGHDCGLPAPAWVDTGAAALVDDHALLHAMLDVEVALATARSNLGVVPTAALEPIRSAARIENLDLAALAAGVRATANPVVVLVGRLTAAVAAIDPAAAEYVHRGSTSQDILDTALMVLCARWKAAGWLQSILDAVDRVRAAHSALPVSLGGAAGTLSAYDQYARIAGAPESATAELAGELGLAEPLVPWHGIRTPVTDVAAAVLVTTGALGKIAADVLVLSRSEIREVAEATELGRGVSSAMPQKRNPVFATLVATAARQLPPIALVLFQSMVVEDERSAGGWHAEWQPLRDCLRLAAGAAVNTAELLEGLRVRPDRMAANLEPTGGAVLSERLNAVLAPLMGKSAAKQLLSETTAEAARGECELIDVIASALDRAGHPVDRVRLAALLEPAGYTGLTAVLVGRVLDRYHAHLFQPHRRDDPAVR